MRLNFLKYSCFTLLTLLFFNSVLYSQASTTKSTVGNKNFKRSNLNFRNSSLEVQQEFVVTDKETILKIAEQDSILNPEEITKITTTYVIDKNLINSSEPENNKNQKISSYIYFHNIINEGSGYSHWNNYDSSIYDGPASVDRSYTREDYAGFSTKCGVTAEIVKAELCVNVSTKYTSSDVYKFSIPEGKTVELRVYTNYNKWTYGVYEDLGGLGYYRGDGFTDKPVGLIFRQYER